MDLSPALPADANERRQAEREEVSCQVVLHTSYARMRGMLTDLATGGARFVAELVPGEGVSALLEWEGHDSICRVVWTKPDACGLAFEPRLARHIVDKYAAPARPAEPPAELGRIAQGKRSSVRTVLVRGGEET